MCARSCAVLAPFCVCACFRSCLATLGEHVFEQGGLENSGSLICRAGTWGETRVAVLS